MTKALQSSKDEKDVIHEKPTSRKPALDGRRLKQ